MTREEIKKFLDNTKVYVNGKSADIQKKLFSFGYKWQFTDSTEVRDIERPFLFIYSDGYISYISDMSYFVMHQNREIFADEILSLEITEPSYRPFTSKDECWEEMLKHQPFGWFRHKTKGHYEPMRIDISEDLLFEIYFNTYTFADGTPFGIKEE